MATQPTDVGARRLQRRLDTLARVTDEPGKLTRTFMSPAMRQANALVGSWMAEAGLKVREDKAGNLIGRWEVPGAPTWVIGSHLDTVRDAGRFDGALGVLIAIAAVEEFVRTGRTLPFSLEVVGFSEEEGVRFSSAYLGSKGYSGQLRQEDLALRDPAGVSVADALRPLGVGSAKDVKPAHTDKDLIGYFEVHIEQGPVLESKGLPLGVVSAIAGQTRAKISFVGKAGHAGTTPMALRRDALAGAAEFALAAESLAMRRPSLVATVGTMSVAPGAANVIPARADFTLDLRHPDDAVRIRSLAELKKVSLAISKRRGLKVKWAITQDNGAVRCSRAVAGILSKSIEKVAGRSVALPSGAGHDGVVMSEVCPVAMLFVRCRDGLSHHPDEFVSLKDLAFALDATVDFLEGLAADYNR